jgi:N-acyl-D-amino-acid deacylase
MRTENVMMKSEKNTVSLGAKRISRRNLLRLAAAASGLTVGGSLLKRATVEAAGSEPCTLLKNGLIVDGTGKNSFAGNLLIKGGRIEEVSQSPISIDCPALDCAGKVVAPGFIDAHSHMDWILPLPGCDELKLPFIAQGCTTFVGGNCGFGVAGFRKSSTHKKEITPGLFPDAEMRWDTMAEYYEHLRGAGMTHNLANFAGHGTIRVSIRGMDPSPLTEDEMKELLALLEKAMDEGAIGVSFGLQYAPGLFAAMDEIKRVAQLVKSKEKILAVHGRAYSILSAEYPLDLFGPPHNLLALNDMVGIARETGVRLQYSHLMFAGTKSHTTYSQCLAAIDAAIADGIDVQTDSYPYHCGNSILGVIIPKWFREKLPDSYHDPEALKRLETEIAMLSMMVGLSYSDIQITSVTHPDFTQYEGMFLSDIAQKRGSSPFAAFIEIAEKSGERDTRVLLHNYSNMEIIDALMQHPACLFMTDALPGKANRNPASCGTFPLFLQYARDRKRISMEQAVRKMTGATADRFCLKDRGYLRKGMAADVTVFDWRAVRDNATTTEFDKFPTGIEAVFMNGIHVMQNGKLNGEVRAGQIVFPERSSLVGERV